MRLEFVVALEERPPIDGWRAFAPGRTRADLIVGQMRLRIPVTFARQLIRHFSARSAG